MSGVVKNDGRDNSPEYIAYKLMMDIFSFEKKLGGNLTREEILDTYAECFEAVSGGRRTGSNKAHQERLQKRLNESLRQ